MKGKFLPNRRTGRIPKIVMIRPGKRLKGGFYFKLSPREAQDIVRALRYGPSHVQKVATRLERELREHKELTAR